MFGKHRQQIKQESSIPQCQYALTNEVVPGHTSRTREDSFSYQAPREYKHLGGLLHGHQLNSLTQRSPAIRPAEVSSVLQGLGNIHDQSCKCPPDKKKLTKEHIVLTPANKMRNNLATQVLDANMLYLMKSHRATLQEPEKIASAIKLLENTIILGGFSWTQIHRSYTKNPGMTYLEMTGRCW